MSGLFQEFKEFALKGNVVDMAVGVIIGSAFGKIISSLVTDVVMPPLGVIIGGVDFTDLKIVLKPAYTDAAGKTVAAVTLNYGHFLQVTIDFLIVALAVFAAIKVMNSLRRPLMPENTDEPKPEMPADQKLLTEIRDLLRARNFV